MDNEVDSKKRTRRLPLAVPVYVQCDGFRTLAYRDEKGVWRFYYNRDPIPGPVSLIPYEPS